MTFERQFSFKDPNTEDLDIRSMMEDIEKLLERMILSYPEEKHYENPFYLEVFHGLTILKKELIIEYSIFIGLSKYHYNLRKRLFRNSTETPSYSELSINNKQVKRSFLKINAIFSEYEFERKRLN
ncbi:hypothetical protein C6501_09075 [Candidatus Poribacteria bacterium]|nr:MAG: hypothetical protein C6501_09075 [Candidatus Poribacteria bacterium]